MGAHARAYAVGDPAFFAHLRAHLAASRAAGLGFDEAWAIAADEMLPQRQRQAEGVVVCQRDLIESTKPAWRRAYRGEPPARAERAVVQLAAVLIEEPSERYADDLPAW